MEESKQEVQFNRRLVKPEKSFILLGPRGTGKTTWLKKQRTDLSLNLLNSRTRLDLERDPEILATLTRGLKPKSWVIIDEIQKIPALLDEVHAIYEEQKINFALSGSSVRKLKRDNANLLAGRAINVTMFPLVHGEYPETLHFMDRVQWGTLPLIIDNFKYRRESLDSYVENYLKQELIEEGLIKKLEPFLRFLHVAANMNGQILNVENIARESSVSRTTVDKYFEVLIDSLIGFKLPAYQPRLKTREVHHAKFYFFDPGVCRASAGLTHQDLESAQLGFYFETYILGEIRAYLSYESKKYDLFHYAISGGGDIDLLVRTRVRTPSKLDQFVVFEMKFSEKWKEKWSTELKNFAGEMGAERVKSIHGIYIGDKHLIQGNVKVWPVEMFLKKLYSGEIL